MKLTIEHSKTKREIVGDFAICGSRADLESLRRQIERYLLDESWSFGWVPIFAARPSVCFNSPAERWD